MLQALPGQAQTRQVLGVPRRDRAVVFAPDGRAAVTYRVDLGVCLAAGDPLGPREQWPAAIDA